MRLRWQLLINSMRRPGRRAELGMQVLWILMGSTFVLFGCIGFLLGGFGLPRINRTDLLDLLLWGVFLIWQLAPVLFEGYSPGLSFREIARYPVSFRVFFLLNAAYGLSDPAAITALLWLLSFWLGLTFARPGWAFTAALALLLFAVFNLLLNRIVIAQFDRLQSTRRGRERMVFLTFMVIILLNLLQINASYLTRVRGVKIAPWLSHAVTEVREFSPQGMAAQVFLGSGVAELTALAGLLLYGLAAYLLLQRQLRVVYQGEIYAETYTVRRKKKVRKGWRLPLVDDVTAAIIEKELRYIRQSGRLLLQLIYPPIIFLVFIFNGPVRKLPLQPVWMLAGVASFMLLSLPNLAYNTFGMDKEGFGRWLLSPPPLQKVLVAKNLTHGGLLALVYLFFLVIIMAMFHLRATPAITVTVAFAAALVIQLGTGNVISVNWPRRVELTQMNSKMSSQAAGLVALLVMIPLSMIVGLITFASWYWKVTWLPLLCGLVILAISLKLYSFVLDRVARYAWEHIEEITGNLSA